MANFEDIFAANPAPALAVAARCEVGQTAIDAVSEELNYPHLQRQRIVLDRRGTPL